MILTSHWETGTSSTGSPVSNHRLDLCPAQSDLFIDDPAVYHGAPVGVQVVARKFEEEKALAIARIVHTVLQGTDGD